MKRLLILFFLAIILPTNIKAQSNKTTVAIEKFVTCFKDNVSPRDIYFCISYLPSTMQCDLPSRVKKYRCKYFLAENTKKLCKKKKIDCFYTIEILGEKQDTIDFIFTLVNVINGNGGHEIFAECRGTEPITPDVRIINNSNVERKILSRILEVGCAGIKRESELH